MRPNLNMADIIELYLLLLEAPAQKVAGEIFNAGYQNNSVRETADLVRAVVEQEMPERAPLEIVTTPSDDIRSYRITSAKLERVLGFVPRHTIADAVRDLVHAFARGAIPNALSDDRYYNVRWMKSRQLR